MVIVHPHPRKEATEPKTVSSMSIGQIDEALTRFVLQDSAHLREDTEELVRDVQRSAATDIGSLVQRVANVSLDRLDDVIVDLRHLRDFVHSEGERIQQELAGFVKLNRAAMDSANLIAEGMRNWKETRPPVAQSADLTSVLPAPTVSSDSPGS